MQSYIKHTCAERKNARNDSDLLNQYRLLFQIPRTETSKVTYAAKPVEVDLPKRPIIEQPVEEVAPLKVEVAEKPSQLSRTDQVVAIISAVIQRRFWKMGSS